MQAAVGWIRQTVEGGATLKISITRAVLCAALLAACAIPIERQGQRLFSGCPDGVDDRANHPLVFEGLDEDPRLLRSHGLVHVIAPGIDEFRQTPKLSHLQRTCDGSGNCAPLGLLGDRVANLCLFSVQAVANHMARTPRRTPGVDFRQPTSAECEALIAYMRSDLVASPIRAKANAK
jgi:hypothetical protein